MTDTVTLPRSVVEQALAAFEHLVRRHYWLGTDYDDRAKSLRAALEQHWSSRARSQASTVRMCPSTYYECQRNCGEGGCKDFEDAHQRSKA